jgi:quinol monooxygenase YgiN
MVLERAEFTAMEGTGDDLAELLQSRGLALAATYTGCKSFKAMRCVEDPDTFMFLAEWVSIEAHQESRMEPAHIQFRELLLPFAASARATVHFVEL